MAGLLTVDAARKVALDALLRFEKKGAERLKADSILHEAAASQKAALSDQDRAFAHALLMGTLRHWFRLNAWMVALTNRPLKQLTPPVRVLLRLGLFQLYGLSHVPAYAAINSTVELAKAQKLSVKTVKFINAVLREAQRRLEDGRLPLKEFTSFEQKLLLEYGWPETWTALLKDTYNEAEIEVMAQATQSPALLSLRVNTLKIAPEDYRRQLQAQTQDVSPLDADLSEVVTLGSLAGSPRQLPGYEEGWFYVQDASSMWVSRLLNPQPGERVLDLCAAPGSKTTHMAALMQNQGHITAIEPKKDRLALLQDNLKRLGVENVETFLTDALTWEPDLAENMDLYDKVLVDAPCSGTGTLRKHPEILLAIKRLDVKAYATHQLALLAKGFACLKPGGVLVYSTCSILKAENQDVVSAFLKKHSDAKLDCDEQRLIHEKADGFYAARILKRV